MSKKSYIHNLKFMEELDMSTDPLLFTEDPQKKLSAGDQVHKLCLKYTSLHPGINYEQALKTVLSYPGNEALAKSYGISPATMI